jgi:hypothetical protein
MADDADNLQGLSGASQSAPDSIQGCKKKHWVKVVLHYEDDHSEVPATECQHLNGDAVNGGPLGSGQLETHNLDDGSYQATFTEIDDKEWELE